MHVTKRIHRIGELLSLVWLCSAGAFASGTTTLESTFTGCATTSLEGAVGSLDITHNTFTVAGRTFKIGEETAFRIPGATKEELKDSPLSKVPRNAKVKILFCSKNGAPVEVKVER
jgi:hypothetical protein